MTEDEDTPADITPITVELLRADTRLPSGNTYPAEVLIAAAQKLHPRIERGLLFGECLDDTPGSFFTHALKDAAVKVTGVTVADGALSATVVPLATPKGKLLSLLLQDLSRGRVAHEIRGTTVGTGDVDDNGVVRSFDLLGVGLSVRVHPVAPAPVEPTP